MVSKIVITDTKLTEQFAYILNTIDVLKSSTSMRTGLLRAKTKKGEDIHCIIIECDLKLTIKKGNALKKTIKSLLQIETVIFEHKHK
jgi:hypothetical protein